MDTFVMGNSTYAEVTSYVNGDDPLRHDLGDTYTDPGATADDGSAVTTDASAVDVNVEGDYVVTYTATDEDGNKGTASRIVDVRGGSGNSNGRGPINVDLAGGGSYPVDIKSVSWDCSEGIIMVTAKPDSEDLHVSVRTTEHGVRQAEALTTDDLLVATGYQIFTVPMHENERYIGVNAMLLLGSQMFSYSESINVDSCVGHKTYGYVPTVTPGDIVQVTDESKADGLIGQEPADVVNVALVGPPA